jgi:hypothetical protein
MRRSTRIKLIGSSSAAASAAADSAAASGAAAERTGGDVDACVERFEPRPTAAGIPKIVQDGPTIKAGPDAKVGDRGFVNGVEYTIRDGDELRRLIRAKRWADVERTCTSCITDFSGLFRRRG